MRHARFQRSRLGWYLTVESCTPGAPSCYGTGRTEPPIGTTKALGELKTYAARQRHASATPDPSNEGGIS